MLSEIFPDTPVSISSKIIVGNFLNRDNKVLIACYHPSPRNVNTKLVTTPMINQLLIKAKKIAKF